jgi:transposase
MANISPDKKEFRSLVLSLKKLNPSWSASQIANFLQQSENSPSLKRHQLVTKIKRVLTRNTIEDKQRSGRPTTISTPDFQQKVKAALRLKKGASIRNVTSNLNRNGIKCSARTVHKAARKLNLKWFKTRKSQKLTDDNKIRRVICAKQLRMKFGVNKKAQKWKWNRIVNTDFSGKFTFLPFQNKRNDGIWAEEGEVVPPVLINAPTDKFQKGIIFWGGISSYGLIPARAPINFTEWLHQQLPQNEKKYLTGDLYAKFVTEKAAPAIKQVFKNTGVLPIFQDDQDSKHRTAIVMDTIDSLFSERVDPEIGDAKLADVWVVENVWGAIKERLRGQQFNNASELENQVAQQWRTFTVDKCRQMIEEIPDRLKRVIDQDGEQIHNH